MSPKLDHASVLEATSLAGQIVMMMETENRQSREADMRRDEFDLHIQGRCRIAGCTFQFEQLGAADLSCSSEPSAAIFTSRKVSA